MNDDRVSRFLVRHRARTLVALGLPTGLLGCGTASPTGRDELADATVVATAMDTASHEPGPPPITDAAGGAMRCGPDQLREVACTENKSAAACPSTHGSRADHYISRIEDFASERPFSFDPVLTADVTAVEPKRPKCCFVRCGELKVGPSAPMPVPRSMDEGVRARCITMPDAPSKFPAPGAPNCAAALALPGVRELLPFQGSTGSFEDPKLRPASWLGGRCCYHERMSLVGVGRPYRIGGQRALPNEAPLAAHDVAGDPRVARHWHAVARGEHASIFAFAALARELAHLGAPRELVRSVLRAQREEARHARLAYGWVERLTGERVTPGDLELAWRPRSLADLARETLRDGCFEEGLGALLAEHLAGRAGPGELGAMLTGIARDEAGHAELSWRILAFAIERDATLLPMLARELENIGASIARLGGAPDAALEQAGVPSEETVRALGERVVREWVAPCLHALGSAAAA